MTQITPPIAKKIPFKQSHHGYEQIDHYAWMRDENWQEVLRDPSVLQADIREHLEAENEYCKARLKDTEALQEQLYKEMRGRIKEDDEAIPEKDGGYKYGVRFVKGGEYAIYYRIKLADESEEILIDGNKMAEGESYFRIADVAHSPNHRYVAYSLDLKGSEKYTIKIIDTETGDLLKDEAFETTGEIVWGSNNDFFHYVKVDDNHRPCEVYRHALGDQGEDPLIFKEEDPGFFVGVGNSQDGQIFMVRVSDHNSCVYYFKNASDKEAELELFCERTKDHEYSIEHRNGEFYILSNFGDREDFAIFKSKAEPTKPEVWTEVIKAETGRLRISMGLLKNWLIYMERYQGNPSIHVVNLSNDESHQIAFDEEAYALGLNIGLEWDKNDIRFTYTSPTTPAQTFEYDLETRSRKLLKETEIPSGHNPSDYVTKRIFAKAHDGAEVPITILHKAGLELNGEAPMLLYGYGAYGHSMPASFSGKMLSLVDRGFVYAIAHVRGGMEKGFHWYKNGKMEHKMNSFKDFISVAEHLIDLKYTKAGNIVAEGRSAGGLLVGAINNMAPELWGAVISEVPFVDTLATILDATLPLTPPEWEEWGNPIESKSAYEDILAYSPMDQIEKKAYPAIYAGGGLTDPRVTYWEPAKWVAKLREYNTSDNDILLHTDMDKGHFGSGGRFEALKEDARLYAFAIKSLGMLDA